MDPAVQRWLEDCCTWQHGLFTPALSCIGSDAAVTWHSFESAEHAQYRRPCEPYLRQEQLAVSWDEQYKQERFSVGHGEGLLPEICYYIPVGEGVLCR